MNSITDILSTVFDKKLYNKHHLELLYKLNFLAWHALRKATSLIDYIIFLDFSDSTLTVAAADNNILNEVKYGAVYEILSPLANAFPSLANISYIQPVMLSSLDEEASRLLYSLIPHSYPTVYSNVVFTYTKRLLDSPFWTQALEVGFLKKPLITFIYHRYLYKFVLNAYNITFPKENLSSTLSFAIDYREYNLLVAGYLDSAYNRFIRFVNAKLGFSAVRGINAISLSELNPDLLSLVIPSYKDCKIKHSIIRPYYEELDKLPRNIKKAVTRILLLTHQ